MPGSFKTMLLALSGYRHKRSLKTSSRDGIEGAGFIPINPTPANRNEMLKLALMDAAAVMQELSY